MDEAVIIAAARTPIGRARKGSLRELRGDQLAAAAIEAAMAQVPQLTPGDIDDLMVGCAGQTGEQAGNIARVVGVMLGWDGVPGTSVNRKCASSLQTTRMAVHAIRAGEGEVFVSAGVESVSRYESAAGVRQDDLIAPVFGRARARTRARARQGASAWSDPRDDGLIPDAYIEMGQTAENVAQMAGIRREEMDELALRSHQRAVAASGKGFWQREIVPVRTPDGTVVRDDDGPRPDADAAALARLAPAFRPDGTVTAGNSCPLNDGAAAVIIASDRRARELGIKPLGRIVATSVSALSPEIMGLGPVESARRVLARAGMSLSDIDLIEINEAFAAQVIACCRGLDLDMGKVNVHGGAIAIGHPFGSTGARILTTLLNLLQWHDKSVGLETMCVGGGQGMSLIVERLAG